MSQYAIYEYYSLIKSKISQANFDAGIALSNKIIQLAPKDPWGFYYKGVCQFALERYEDAIKNYRKALELNPIFAKAYFNAGVCYFMLQYNDYAMISIAKALLIFSKSKNKEGKERCIEALKLLKERGKKWV